MHIVKFDPKCLKDTFSWSNGIWMAWWRNDRASDFRPRGHGFDPRSGRSCVTTLGKLFTPTCLYGLISRSIDSTALAITETSNFFNALERGNSRVDRLTGDFGDELLLRAITGEDAGWRPQRISGWSRLCRRDFRLAWLGAPL